MQSKRPKNRPNIVLMVSDDHGLETLGCYGNAAVHTPRLDSLAGDGVRFTNAFCTSASCAASRANILTGLYNHATGAYGHTHGVNHFSCFDNIETLPALLNKCGYRTGRVGKKHYAPDRLFPFAWGCPDNRFGRDDVRMSEACREFVRGPAPFFLYWCSKNPHRAFFKEDHPLRPNRFGNPLRSFPGDKEKLYAETEVQVPPFLNDTPAARAELAQYYQSISRLDRGVGKLMDVLKEEGQYDNTVVIYISDNGAAFPQAKTNLYEPGMRLPCIIRTPWQRSRGGICDGLITWTDMAPTILDFARCRRHPSKFHGRSFKNIIGEKSPKKWRAAIYASHTFHGITNYYPMRVIRTKKFKFIWNIAWKLDYSFASDLWASAYWQAMLRDGGSRLGAKSLKAYLHRPRFELYDLENDPNETKNLADKPAYGELVADFTAQLKTFQKETSDPWIHKWIYD